MIVDKAKDVQYRYPITGIAGHKNFSLISIEKAMMNAELGFGRRVLQAVEEFGISFEHLPTGIDTMCVVVSDVELNRYRDKLINRINELCQPDHIEISSGLALIATVGQGMVRTARHGGEAVWRALCGRRQRAHDRPGLQRTKHHCRRGRRGVRGRRARHL